ncbi:MAG: polyribonucleotide nucleotidyltransferase [Firmicutes bacterium]|nr:polyribonucleotide nucleotidyltransferase [Bacillota bacterium]
MKKIFEKEFHGRKLVVESGELAKQANGSVLVRFGDTAILTAAVMSKNTSQADFFPLTVLYQEKLYSVGKIPGGFIKREGRPTENATLTARLIDRPIRPLFDDGFRNEVQVVNTVLSVDQDATPEMSALLGSSLALLISDIPFTTPVAGVVVGRVDGTFVIDPTPEELEKSDIHLTVAGTKEAINMVESGSTEVSEEDMIDAIMFGHDAIKELIAFEEEIVAEIGKEKVEVELKVVDKEIEKEVYAFAYENMKSAIQVVEKLARQDAVDKVKEETVSHFEAQNQEMETLDAYLKDVKHVLEDMEAMEVRRLIIEEKVRPDGRKIDEIRPLSASIDILARTHGSALFTRGQTQALAVTTLGALGEHQILDGLELEDEKRFMLHYNFPQFSVGETGRYGSPGRREIGHGALGERALAQVIPSEEEFPYTIRVVSEILESNGSSSQASICAGCLSLMAAGVPIKAPVAGIAMGLITDEENYTILTDIQGLEDHMGDMDFKVAGTRNGICALQMDIKIKGVTREILKEALDQAKVARMQILDVMEDVIKEPRKEVSKYAPKICEFHILPEQIKDVIGRGGDVITKIIQDASNVISVNDKDAVKIDIEEDGQVLIYHNDMDIIEKAKELILNITRVPEEGNLYTAKVVKVEDFGCFVQIWPGCEGLVHVSKLDYKRVEKASDIVKVGDEILVKCLGKDKKGRLNFSRKDALTPPKEEEKTKKTEKED